MNFEQFKEQFCFPASGAINHENKKLNLRSRAELNPFEHNFYSKRNVEQWFERFVLVNRLQVKLLTNSGIDEAIVAKKGIKTNEPQKNRC